MFPNPAKACLLRVVRNELMLRKTCNIPCAHIGASKASPYIIGRQSESTVWVGPKWPYPFVCLSVTYCNHPNCVILFSALGAMATSTLSDDSEPPQVTRPQLHTRRQAESAWGEGQGAGTHFLPSRDCAAATDVAGKGQTVGADLPPGWDSEGGTAVGG